MATKSESHSGQNPLARKRIVVQIELDQIDQTEEEETRVEQDFVVWLENYPGHRDRRPWMADIAVVYPCARCGFANTCKRIFGEDCHI